MSYSKYYANGWQDNESGGTPITAAALNHMENGIEDLDNIQTANLSTGSPALTHYLPVYGSSYYKALVSDVAKLILNNYTGLSLAGSAQSVKSAIDSLNSNRNLNVASLCSFTNIYSAGDTIQLDSNITDYKIAMILAGGGLGYHTAILKTSLITTTSNNFFVYGNTSSGTPTWIKYHFTDSATLEIVSSAADLGIRQVFGLYC